MTSLSRGRTGPLGSLHDLVLSAPSPETQSLSELLRQAASASSLRELNSFFDSAVPEISRVSFKALSRFREIQEADKDAIVQAVLVKVWQHLLTLDDARNPAAWIARTTRNLAIDYLRVHHSKSSLRSNFLDQAEHSRGPFHAKASEELDPAKIALNIESEQLAQNLKRRLFSSLPPLSREIIRLRIEGFTYQDIADTQAIPISTVKGRIRAIRAALSSRIVGWKDGQVVGFSD